MHISGKNFPRTKLMPMHLFFAGWMKNYALACHAYAALVGGVEISVDRGFKPFGLPGDHKGQA